jgi:hypothetical protein
MNRSTALLLSCLALAAVYVFLFHGTGTGLNLLLFELLAAIAVRQARPVALPPLARLTLGGTLLTAVMVVVHGSLLTVVVNLLSAGLTVGILLAPSVNALHRSTAVAAAHLASIPLAFLQVLPFRRSAGITARGVLSLAFVPLVLLLFTALYSNSNPHFDQAMTRLAHWLDRLDLALLGSFLLGLLISGFLLFRLRNEGISAWAREGHDQLLPAGEGPQDGAFQGERLKALLLLAGLNGLLLVANVLDIRYVWSGFEFNGRYLKQFVHEGTYMLLLSILIGAGIVLYYFRGDLNFHRGNRAVKWLSYAWLAQNLVLALSVGMRNYWYIHYYALAYKRIGVGFFLLALCIGLLLVMVKVRRGRTAHYLLRTNTVVVYSAALCMSLFNWDGIIARYNMAQAGQAFVHLDFLSTLSDKALPDLMRSPAELEKIDAFNATLIGGAERYSRELYMNPEAFRTHIDQRVQDFLAEFPKRSWREWNRADAQAYESLQAHGAD